MHTAVTPLQPMDTLATATRMRHPRGLGWAPDGRLVVSDNGMLWLYKPLPVGPLCPQGALPRLLPVGPMTTTAFGGQPTAGCVAGQCAPGTAVTFRCVEGEF